MSKLTIKSPAPIGLADIAEQAAHSIEMMSQIRAAMLSPTTRKAPPVWNLSQLAQLLNIEKGSLTHRMGRGDLPQGELNAVGNRRQFTLAEVRAWVREYRKESLRPVGAEAVTVSIANFKGGVGKTTTAVTLAQGMSLLGHKVLVIDTDPQGSLTTLFGILPDSEVEEEDTILPLVMGAETSIRYAIRPTYWDGVDLVPAAPLLFGAEFALPARQTQEEGFEFWNVLNYGIDDVRGDYDVIVIDTPPALSYTTINAFMASDGIIMPLPPSTLDFASASQFWSLFSDLATQLLTKRGLDKEFDFVHILLAASTLPMPLERSSGSGFRPRMPSGCAADGDSEVGGDGVASASSGPSMTSPDTTAMRGRSSGPVTRTTAWSGTSRAQCSQSGGARWVGRCRRYRRMDRC